MRGAGGPDQAAAQLQQELFVLDEQAEEESAKSGTLPSLPSSEAALGMPPTTMEAGENLARSWTEADDAAVVPTPSHPAPAAADHDAEVGGAGKDTAQQGERARKLEQFSVQILRCRVLCPDWRDTAFAPGTPRERDEGVQQQQQHARGSLVLDMPHALLQLPLEAPAAHPDMHPVQQRSGESLGDPAGISGRRSWDRGDDSTEADAGDSRPAAQGWAAEDDEGTAAVVFSGRQLGFRVEVFDPGKDPLPAPGPAFLGIPHVRMHALGLQALPGDLRAPSSVPSGLRLPTHELHITSMSLSAEPQQLQLLRAALEWGAAEQAHILGRAAAQAAQPRQPRQRRGSTSTRSLLEGLPCSLSMRVERVALALRGAAESVSSGAAQPPSLLLQAHALSAHAARTGSWAGCSVSLDSALLLLAGLPPLEPEAAARTGSEEAVAKLEAARPGKLLIGRSASAPAEAHLKHALAPRV